MSSVVAPKLLTAEEFVAQYVSERVELVRGVVEELPVPWSIHGKICATFVRHLGNWADENDSGHVISHDSWIRTERGPDSVRGPDVMYYHYDRMPPDAVPEGLPELSPDLVAEVRSPSDRTSKIIAKVSEYLDVGIRAVLLIEPQQETVTVFREHEFHQTFHNGDSLTVPDVLPGFSLPLAKLFAGKRKNRL